MKGWAFAAIFGLALVAVVVRSCAERSDAPPDSPELRAALHTADTIRARSVEREMRALASNDSLKLIIRGYKAAPPTKLITRADTVAHIIYVRDTLVPACEACSARQDSLAADRAAERRAWFRVDSLRVVEYAGLRRKIARGKLTSRIGLSCGYGVMKVGNDVKAGPTCGVSIRVWP